MSETSIERHPEGGILQGPQIEGAFDYWNTRFPPKSTLQPPQWQHLNARLSPKGTKTVSLANVLAREDEELIELTNEQIRALGLLRAIRRLKVQGCAGSGKTVLAVAEAKRLGAQGKQVLLLCFNRLLANHLQTVLADAPGVVAFGFHELCKKTCDDLGVDPTDPGSQDNPNEYWRTHLPLVAFSHLREWETRYDAVIVDEGQDFRADWWEMVECLVRPDGRLVVFYDPNQDIFAVDGAIPIDGDPAQLTVNCRSTAAINRAARAVGEVVFPCEDGPVEGEPPTVRAGDTAKNLVGELSGLLTELIDRQRLKTDSVVILSPRRLENSSLKGQTKIGSFELVEDTPLAQRQVLFATLQRFKGLEADVVLLIDLDLDSASCRPENLYVGFSRAKHRLHIWAGQDQVERLRGIVAGER